MVSGSTTRSTGEGWVTRTRRRLQGSASKLVRDRTSERIIAVTRLMPGASRLAPVRVPVEKVRKPWQASSGPKAYRWVQREGNPARHSRAWTDRVLIQECRANAAGQVSKVCPPCIPGQQGGPAVLAVPVVAAFEPGQSAAPAADAGALFQAVPSFALA